MNTTAVVKKEQFQFVATTLEEAERHAEIIAGTNMIPQAYKNKPGDVMVAIQIGQEVGLKPLQALQSIAVINGTPSVWGQGLLAIIQSSDVCEYIFLEYDEATQVATCTTKRVGHPREQVFTFSMADAQEAGLHTRETYKKYPQNMLRWKALGLAAKFVYPDVSKGLVSREEAEEYPPERGASRVDELNSEIERQNKRRASQPDGVVDSPEIQDATFEEMEPEPTPRRTKPEVSHEPQPEPGNPGQEESLFSQPAISKKKEKADPEPEPGPKSSRPQTAFDKTALVDMLDAEAGLSEEDWQDLLCALITGDPECTVSTMTKDEGNRIYKTTKFILKETGLSMLKGLLAYCAEGDNNLWLRNEDEIRDSWGKFQSTMG